MGVKKQAVVDLQHLITPERVENLELLVQLISSQREPLVVCGANGIGKTTLLNTLKNTHNHLWAICFFQGTEPLSFGDIKRKLRMAITTQGSMLSCETLEDMLTFYEKHQQKVVLILDNAGRLPSGFIDKLIKYSLKYSAIRIIFALTKKELSLKNKTDISIDNCYFVEIPALEKQDIKVFLHILASLPDALGVKGDVNDKLLNRLYQRTNGIPGKIISELQNQTNRWFKWQQSLLLISGVSAIFALVYLYKPVFEQTNLYQSLFIDKSQIKINVSQIANLSKHKLLKPVVETKNQQIEQKADSLNNPLLPKHDTAVSTQKKRVVKIKKSSQTDDAQWVLQQAAKKYTLQLVLTSKRSALLKLLKKYPRLRGSLKYVRITRNNKRLYLLFYGAFSTAKIAQKWVKTLPQEFKQAWAKQFGALQVEIRKSR